MPIEFNLDQRLTGFTATTVPPGGGEGWVCTRELVGPADAAHLLDRLEKLQGTLFHLIPGLPAPSQVDHLLVLIRQDLSAIAFVNELQLRASVQVNRSVRAGEPIQVQDITDIAAVDLGVPVPDDSAIVFVRSHGWRRSLFYDFDTISPEATSRDFDLKSVLAKQMLLLLGLPVGGTQETGQVTRVEHMEQAIATLEKLLADACEIEAQYQELLAQHPWMLGRPYSEVVRHQPLDDSAIPDLTAIRCYDGCHDIIELKQPFLPLFKASGQFAAPFNDAWNQVESYLQFTLRNRGYLLQEKGLRFENPSSILICGHSLQESELATIRQKESISRAVSVLTYDHLLKTARHVLDLVRTAGDVRI
ncbi:MAG: DUF4263 domain-containing protein [Gemmatimonadetes bacterium]|jgi:hypothetical protein|nr:DUF4263 domain-containing protein [Gemmatimonadota bacterium]MBT7912831.1 DUF4263 domain-containing protein [Candidatus Bathyarchaeota archaeon]